VVTVNSGLEVHDAQKGVNGYVFPMDNVEALAEKIQMLMRSEASNKRIGEGGISTMRDRINIGRMIEGFRRAIFTDQDSRALAGQVNKMDMMNSGIKHYG
jgi:glycosyltransferase involved in cell wall biosynthesis